MWEALQVGLFHHSSSTIRLGDESYFFDSPQGGNLHYENGRLAVHTELADLDLQRAPEDSWSGRLHRKEFDQRVVLKRRNESVKRMSPFAGTWRRKQDQANFYCLHIVQTGADAFSGWEDLNVIPGLLRYAAQIKKPPAVLQTYGNAIRVSSQGSNYLQLDSPVSLAGCCSYSSIAKLEGHTMNVQPLEGWGPWDGKNWTKMPGSSCVLAPRRKEKKVARGD